MGRLIWGLSGLLLSSTALASEYNMPVGVTEISREVYGLHMLIFWVCCAIAAVVFGAMIYSIIAHRKSVHPKPADFHESIKVEIAWTVAPFVILIAMAIPAAGTLIKMEDTSDADMTIKITGYQWKWQYEYMEEGVSFFSSLDTRSNEARQLGSGINPADVPNYLLDVDEPLVLPVGKKIRLLLTSNDVIHAWWVPAFATKKDAVPGYINEMWTKIDEPGIYRGQCAELCGRDHGFMPVVVRAVSQQEYDRWIAERGGKSAQAMADAPQAIEVASAAPAVAANASAELSKAVLMGEGEKVYKNYCSACHQADGSGMAAANFPALTGSAVANGPVDVHIDRVLKGAGAMAAFAYLKDREIAAVVTYERNALGNSAGDVVQPAQVAARR
ncbi:MAG: cytochrome c oxidase subunit II [Oceanococcus sp.]